MPNPFRLDADRILVEQLRLVLGNYRSTFPVLLIPVLLYWVLSNSANNQSLLFWSIGVVLSHLALQFFTRRYFFEQVQPEKTVRVVVFFSFLHFIDAVMWGFLSWITLDTVTQSGFVLVVAVFAGMLGGGLATLSTIPFWFLVFALPQAVMLSVKLWAIGDATYIALSLGVVIYLVAIMGQVFNSARVTRESILLRFDLADSYVKLREVERQKTLDAERQRLMQDMHDGLGSSLISALRVVERGNMNDEELALVLKGCIDDLKIAIDSLEHVDSDLLLLLATLRFRLEPRLKAAGIALKWHVQNLPDLDWLDSRSALHILRILQEAIANIIKHTTSSEVFVITSVKGDCVQITIADNGQGFDVAKALNSKGKGLSGQKNRAAAIDAKIKWESDGFGTRVSLMLPLYTIST
jgi:signal transduction histidine kinase